MLLFRYDIQLDADFHAQSVTYVKRYRIIYNEFETPRKWKMEEFLPIKAENIIIHL